MFPFRLLVCVHLHACSCVCVHAHACAGIRVCVHTHTHVCIHACVQVHVCVCVYTCVEVRGQSQVLLLGAGHKASSWPQTHQVGSAVLTNSDPCGTDLSLLSSGTAISSFSFFKIFNLGMCVYLCWYAHVCACGGGKKVLGPLELAFHA